MSKRRSMKLLISLHDVTPFHLSRLSKAEALFQEMGLRKIIYLFIPNYHGRNPSSEHPEFKAWCHGARAFQVRWHLHGDQHLEAVSPARDGAVSWTDRLRRRFLTAGEGGISIPGLGNTAEQAQLRTRGLPPLPGRGPHRICAACLAVQFKLAASPQGARLPIHRRYATGFSRSVQTKASGAL